jgi:hypothetical protein
MACERELDGGTTYSSVTACSEYTGVCELAVILGRLLHSLDLGIYGRARRKAGFFSGDEVEEGKE